jgi:hypothetical protein
VLRDDDDDDDARGRNSRKGKAGFCEVAIAGGDKNDRRERQDKKITTYQHHGHIDMIKY